MIKIVSKNLIKESEVEHFLELVREMAAKSIAEKGCISYSLNQSITNPRVYTFIECWEDQAAIDAHNKSTPTTIPSTLRGSFPSSGIFAKTTCLISM